MPIHEAPPAQMTYSQGYNSAVLRQHGARTASNSCGHFTHLLQPNFNILDVGCGPGSITSSLAQLVPQGIATGIDTSEQVIEAANSKPNLPENCKFRVGSALQLPFKDASFDVVSTNMVLCHLPDPVPALREMKRVCKPGGFVACRENDWDTHALWPVIPGLRKWEAATRAAFVGNDETLADPKTGRRLLEYALRAGFSTERLEFSIGTMTYAGADKGEWGERITDRIKTDDTMRTNMMDRGGVTEDDLKEISDAWLEWTKTEAAMHVIVAGQIVAYT
ncbi:MAG: hypothetical protein M1831_006295 [Alyxoria varia]|nr:MAG: hypothetical protein M1831_006295 [Alyxoria varia]